MNNEVDHIKLMSQTSENKCSCNTCKSMCRRSPCIGTPADMLALINAGFTDKLCLTEWLAGKAAGVLPELHMVTPLYDYDHGCCSFLTGEGLCQLHDLGLKPIEGKLASCKNKGTAQVKHHVTFMVGRSWTNRGSLPQQTQAFTYMVKYLVRQPNKPESKTIYYLGDGRTV
jgi:hypothetical protein